MSDQMMRHVTIITIRSLQLPELIVGTGDLNSYETIAGVLERFAFCDRTTPLCMMLWRCQSTPAASAQGPLTFSTTAVCPRG